MAFSEEIVEEAWGNAGGKCECERSTHGHIGRCGKVLMKSNRGREGLMSWEANHKVRQESGGSDDVSNCEILCWPCHKKTF